ncbi:sigma-70 family RNA polymerase sigma factor [bacterium]|nr:sigma-70 family RNA polymerase sigma factor [bacterium]
MTKQTPPTDKSKKKKITPMTTLPVLSGGSMTKYLRGVLAIPHLEREEEILLFKKFKNDGDVESARQIILANLKLVVNLAYKFRKFRDSSDLIQEGNLGLMTALQKFDLDKGVRFATYASWWVKAKIQEFIISHMSIVRFGKSRDERRLFFNLVSTIKEIESYDNGRELSPEELVGKVAEKLEVTPEKVRDAMAAMASYNDISIHEELSDGTPKLLELKTISTFDDDIDFTIQQEQLQAAMKELNEREQFIVTNRFLVDNPMTLLDIGKKYNISKERVRQLESNAIKKLKNLISL